MRRAVVRTLALAAAVLLVAQLPSRADTLVLDRFRDYIESLRVQAGIPGLASAIIGSSDILWEKGLGLQDVERSIRTAPDTPFHVDGVTEIYSATLVLQCVEEGRASLEDTIGKYKPTSPDANLTLREALTHTTGAADNASYAYRPDRLDVLGRVIRACTKDSYRETTSVLLERFAMVDSVPGPDIVHPELLTEGIPSPQEVARYNGVLARLAVPYSVDTKGRPTPSAYPATTLTATSGLISTVRDFANFDMGLKQGLLLGADTLAASWQAPAARNGQRMPHGIGWFVQNYNGQLVVWQFGLGENASSSLVVMVPARGLTLVLLANSNGLVKPYPLSAGDVTVSPFARVFLELFAR
jgi:CubicO group peptidase (beta-lactamase class C family)